MKRSMLKVLACVVMALAACAVHAQDYPARPVKIIVPFAVGGPADVYARFLGARLQESMGQPFVIENRPGAGAVTGTDAVAKSRARRLHAAAHVQRAHGQRDADPEQAVRAAARLRAGGADQLFGPHAGRASRGAANTLPNLIALAKAQPGKLNYASSGPGTPYHMAGELFKSMAGVDIVHVPYKESSAARTGVIGGQVEMMFDAVTTMNEQAKAGKVRPLATSGKTRSAVMPNVPTMSEAGVPGYEAVIWLGVMAPKGTPPAIVNRLNAEIREDRRPARSARRVGEAGRVGDDDDARRIRALRRRRHRQVGKGHQGLGRQARPVTRGARSG